MSYLIGIDEAGYGPNLGPLVIGGSLWHVADASGDVDLYERLSGVVVADRSRLTSPDQMVMADSKQVYQPRQGVGTLERGVWPALAVAGAAADTWHGLWRRLDGEAGTSNRVAAQIADSPWYADYETSLPETLSTGDLARLSDALRMGLDAASIRLVALRAVAVFPHRFNEQTRKWGSKGEVLSRSTFRLVAGLLDLCGAGPIEIVCDKHGGRNRYGPLLQQQFPEPLIEIVREGRQESTYRWGPPERRIQMHFRVGGEAVLQTALASMLAKYLRELTMTAWNEYWCQRVAGLRPTAGYPLDARRFKADIDSTQQELGIADDLVWRIK